MEKEQLAKVTQLVMGESYWVSFLSTLLHKPSFLEEWSCHSILSIFVFTFTLLLEPNWLLERWTMWSREIHGIKRKVEEQQSLGLCGCYGWRTWLLTLDKSRQVTHFFPALPTWLPLLILSGHWLTAQANLQMLYAATILTLYRKSTQLSALPSALSPVQPSSALP